MESPGGGRGQASPAVEKLWLIVKGWHSVTLSTGKLKGATMSKRACTGAVFSVIPPEASAKETIIPRQSLKKPAARRPVPKFGVLISLPPYLLRLKGFIFLSPCYIGTIT
jgi:hypothetical protein